MNSQDIIKCLDYTLLNLQATDQELSEFCEKANQFRPIAVCVFSKHAKFVKPLLDEGIRLSVVASGFPEGSTDLEEISESISKACTEYVDEVDVVLEPRNQDFPNETDLERLVAIRKAAGNSTLKIILETPLLEERPLRAVARMALAAGADFVKSCTGKRGSCSEEAASILAYEVMRHERTFNEQKGLKLSGGIRTLEDVNRLTRLVNNEDPSIIESGSNRFRIGASSLLDQLA
tara:strand:- start:1274 stop:1975 length:702 start_codon:yes stop_codon:yes gene_type:complete